jgi:hypothetical protein
MGCEIVASTSLIVKRKPVRKTTAMVPLPQKAQKNEMGT